VAVLLLSGCETLDLQHNCRVKCTECQEIEIDCDATGAQKKTEKAPMGV
jgi:hypothetical protein